MDNEIEIRADELKKIKPNECGLVRDIVSGGLQKLSEFGIPFSVSVSMEKDSEDENWSYALVKISMEGKYSGMIQNDIIRYAYEGVDPSDATKVLLVLENV